MNWFTPNVVAALGALVIGVLVIALIRDFFTRDCDATVRAALRSMPLDAFKGKIVWIVGASSGIGEALAHALAKRGARLVLSARRIDRLRIVAQECSRLGSPQADVLELDVLNFDSHIAAARAAANLHGGRIDFLVNNAGRSQRALVEDSELAVDQDLFQLNVLGVLSVTKAVLPYFLQQGSGCIANTSSIAGKTGSPGSATYAATKAAINAYMNSLRMEVGYRGIRVVNVCPGPVTSEITMHAFTGTAGRTVGHHQESSINRMPSERCAELYAAAMWRGLPEIWVSPQPILLYTYLAQYMPSIFAERSLKGGQKRVEDFRAGNTSYSGLQNPFAMLFGGVNSRSKQA